MKHVIEDDLAVAVERTADAIARWMQDFIDDGIAEFEQALAKHAAFVAFLRARGDEYPI